MKPTNLFRPLLAASILAAAGAAQAQAFDAVRMYGDPTGDGAGTAGLAAIAGYRYMGSDERRASVLPALEYRWKNGWFVGTTNGIGYKFSSDPSMQYGVRLTADFGRSESRSPVLAGMGDIKARPEIGGFLLGEMSANALEASTSSQPSSGPPHSISTPTAAPRAASRVAIALAVRDSGAPACTTTGAPSNVLA